MSHFPELPGPASIFDSIYRRTPRGIARLCVAGGAGALFAIYAVLDWDGTVARQYWYVFAGCGLAIGLIGGSILGVLERREAAGQGPPLAWVVFRNIAVTFLQLLGLFLVVMLFYVMYRVVHDEHLWGF